LPSDSEITSVAISPTDRETAYAADAAKIYKTTDDGKTWNTVATS
jgi:photosystem II stability/assembly factor-like uncharacterized protein